MRKTPTGLGEVMCKEKRENWSWLGPLGWPLALLPCHSLPPVCESPLAKCLCLFHSSQVLQLTQSLFNYLFTQAQEDSR